MFENMCIFQLHVRVHVQENKNEHVASSCCALALSPSEVLKEVKVARMRAFKQMSAGYEMGMKECPNCKQIGLFVHDANQAKCVHPDHERICAELIAKADEEAASAARRAKEPTKRGCSTCEVRCAMNNYSKWDNLECSSDLSGLHALYTVHSLGT